MEPKYDVLILTTAKDFERVKCNYPRLIQNMAPRRVLFVGSTEVGRLTEELREEFGLGENVGVVEENTIVSFAEVHEVMKDALGVTELARGVTGWYYQQFLKMNYSAFCKDDYYLVWDGDTVPCKPFTMFHEDGVTPYLDLKKEYHEEYFKTIEKLFPGMHKSIEKSFISEHMLMKTSIMQNLIKDIEDNAELVGETFWEKILRVIPKDKLTSNSFSEFETYGTYVAFRYTSSYRLRNWHSFRYAGSFFRPEEMTDEDYRWLAVDFDAASFEKNQIVTPEQDNLFNNKRYQQALSARKMLEVIQEEFTDGYTEVWDSFSETKEKVENTEYKVYEQLAEQYWGFNPNKAFLCCENAEYLCYDKSEKMKITEKKKKMLESGRVTVKRTSIVIVSYNNKYLMQKCIESIRNTCPDTAIDVVVVDNASTDGVREWLQQQLDIRLILCEQNVGFPMGCNIGVEYAEENTDIFLLNNDTRLTKNSLFWLRMGLYENEKVGATGSVTNYCGNEQQVNVEFALPGDYVEYGASVNVPKDYPYEERNRLCGYAMLIRREAWNESGGMDISFSPGYYEDDDLCTSIKRLGYNFYICHNSFIYHAGSQSFSKREDLQNIIARNYYHFLDKWGYDITLFSQVNHNAINKLKEICSDKIRVLEIGAGCGVTLSRIKYLYPDTEVMGVEKNVLAAKYSIDCVPIVNADWEQEELPFELKGFDIIIYSNHAGERINREYFMSKVGKYLKDEGVCENAVIGDFEN